MEAIISNVFCVLVVIVLFGITIFVHELGHFLVALRCGMVIDVFSIGFGPAIWSKKHKDIVYKIGCIPFGGYVAIPQLDPSSMDTLQGQEDGKQDRNLPTVSPWKKILVSIAGGCGNVLFGTVLAWIIFFSPDIVPDEKGAVLGHVAEDSTAYESGLRPGDEILKVNDEPVSTWTEFIIECHLVSGRSNRVRLTVKSGEEVKKMDLPTVMKGEGVQRIDGIGKAHPCQVGSVVAGSPAKKAGLKSKDIIRKFDGEKIVGSDHFIYLVGKSRGKEVPIVVERKGGLTELMVKPRYNPEHDRVMIGIHFSQMYMLPWMQYKKPMDQIRYDAKGIFRILRALLSRREGEAKQAVNALGGPPAILLMLWASIKISILNGIGFIRFLNINLAILNLLPLPVLDGGHIVFSLWEGISRRKIHPKLVNALVNVFLVLIIGLMIFLSIRDIVRFPRWLGHGDNKEPPAVEQTDD